jgi:hypothetical protein
MAQLQVNLAEAQSHNTFIAGWRPFLGWVMGAAFGWTFVIGPMFYWIATALGYKIPNAPTLDMTTMMPVLLGMLGLGTMRTVEKVKDAAGNH